MEGPIKELNVVFIVIMRKMFKLLFGKNAESVINPVEILLPIFFTGCDIHSN